MEGRILDGRYEVIRLLGKGGMGAVYEGRAVATGRRVAVKVITADVVKSPNLVARFEVEARAAGTIESQHIAQIIDSGRDGENGPPYLVMEYLAGEDLYQALRRLGPLPVGLVLRIMAQVCLGIDKAHRARIIHRDIKPANIYLNERDGDEILVKLLDFGVAKITIEEGQNIADVLTRTGSILGSPLYMSPEQAKGDKTIDHRSDIWALGVVMYEMLVGRTPFHHIEAFGGLVIAICSEAPTPVTTAAPWVPEEVSAIVHKALALKADDRFQSAHEMYKAIKAYIPPGGQGIDKSMFLALSSDERAMRPGPLAALQSGDRSTSQPGLPPDERASNPVLASSPPNNPRTSSPSNPAAPSFLPQGASVPERARTTAGVTSEPTPPAAAKSKLSLAIAAAVVVLAAGAFLALHGSSTPAAPTNAARAPEPPAAPVTATVTQTAAPPAPPSAAPSTVPTVTPAETAAPAPSESSAVKAAPTAAPAAGHFGKKPPGAKTGPGATTNVGGRIIRTDLP